MFGKCTYILSQLLRYSVERAQCIKDPNNLNNCSHYKISINSLFPYEINKKYAPKCLKKQYPDNTNRQCPYNKKRS